MVLFGCFTYFVNYSDCVVNSIFTKRLFFSRYTGGRPDETVAALVVGHAGAGSHPPAHAQQPGQRDHVAQRAKVRSTRSRSTRGHHDG